MIDNFGTPFDSEVPLSIQAQLPKCYTKVQAELKAEYLVKFNERTLIYIFYNYENRAIQLEAVKILYTKGWVYNYEACLWFHNLDLVTMENRQFFNIKIWDMAPYQSQLKKEQFAKIDDFEANMKIKESSITSNSS